jgi:type 1 glutamine amidotransferase
MRLFCLLLGFCLAVSAQPAPIKTLIFSGRNNHDWRSTTPFLKKILVDSGRFDVRVTEEPAGATAGTLVGYDLLILDYNGPRWGAGTERAVDAFVRSGKGLVGVHAAGYAFAGLPILGDRHVSTGRVEPAWPEFFEMLGGRWQAGPPATGHGDRHSFKVRFTKPDHPIASGLSEGFIATDELYHSMQMHPGAQVLATAFDDPKRRGTGKEEPILWTVEYGKGRVFMDQLGHDLTAMAEPGFISTFVRGAEWAATGRVATATLPKPDSVRVLVVTGGHPYDTSFYTLFEGYPDVRWTHAFSNTEAFKNDIRAKFDVLVLYDLHTDIAEPEKRHLRDFVESGKGAVVLHHAIADYNNWTWWYQDVVGGRYLLKKEGSVPASTYKHDVEVMAEPVGRHPITAGVGPLHFVDESYKSMWISPSVQVILTTANAEWDGPLAWVSPYQKSRVVYIQLGHDEVAHRNPGYRTLIRNAILWTASRAF